MSPPGKNCDFLQDLAGNMWSCFHFLPVFVASLGAVDWTAASLHQKAALDTRRQTGLAAESQSSAASSSLDDADSD